MADRCEDQPRQKPTKRECQQDGRGGHNRWTIRRARQVTVTSDAGEDTDRSSQKEINTGLDQKLRMMSRCRAGPRPAGTPISRVGAPRNASQHDVHDADPSTKSEIDAMATNHMSKIRLSYAFAEPVAQRNDHAEVSCVAMRGIRIPRTTSGRRSLSAERRSSQVTMH